MGGRRVNKREWPGTVKTGVNPEKAVDKREHRLGLVPHSKRDGGFPFP